jgi:hypothetical protein
MTQKQSCVGIVGANPQRRCANVSHVPAINGLSGLRLAVVATRNEQNARKSTEAFGAKETLRHLTISLVGENVGMEEDL